MLTLNGGVVLQTELHGTPILALMIRPHTMKFKGALWVGAIAAGALIVAGCSMVAAGGGAKARGSTLAGPAGQLAFDDGGRGGMPVLFVHSFAGSSAHWRAQLAHLRATRRAVAMDLRGHGRSDPPRDEDFAVPALAADIAAVADGLGLKRFVLVGHSMGGAAAVAYAGQHPGRVAGLVLVGTPGKAAPAQAQQIMASLQADYDKVMASYWDALLVDAQPSVRSLLQAERTRVAREPSMAIISAIFAFDPLPALAAYPGPKLVIDITRSDNPGALFRQVGIAFQLVEGTSHWVQLDKPQDFNARLDVFLAQAQ